MNSSIIFMKISVLVLYITLLVHLVVFGSIVGTTILLFIANISLYNLCWLLLWEFVWGYGKC